MNAKDAPARRRGLRPRHLFFAAAVVIATGFILYAVTLPTLGGRTYVSPTCTNGICIPGRYADFPVIRRIPLRLEIAAAGAALALIVAGIGLAVDRR